MARYRPLYVRIWKDPDFQEYSSEGKLVFIYLCTNESVTASGIYPITPKTIANETNVDQETVDKLLTNGSLKNVFYDQENKYIFVKNLRNYNPGGKPDLICESIKNDHKHSGHSPLWQEFFKAYPEIEPLVNPCLTVGKPLVKGSIPLTLTLKNTGVVKGDNDKPTLMSSDRLNPKKGAQPLSEDEQNLFDILLRCPEVKEADAAKLPELLSDYPGVDYNLEFKKFIEWWPGPKPKPAKRPWATLRNWLEKVSEEGNGEYSNPDAIAYRRLP